MNFRNLYKIYMITLINIIKDNKSHFSKLIHFFSISNFSKILHFVELHNNLLDFYSKYTPGYFGFYENWKTNKSFDFILDLLG